MDALTRTLTCGATAGGLDWAAAGRPIEGEIVSGDLHLVAPFAGGVLIAVVDGLGHGREAEASARAALDVMGEDPSLPVDVTVARCHRALARLRGAVMSLASFDATAASLTWIGIGNVEGVLLRAQGGHARRERLLLWGGIVGQTLPRLRPATLPVSPGDTLLLATDGIQADSLDDIPAGRAVEDIAGRVLARHARGTDDALVLVARRRGGAP
jgi:negative regulator of sigma-B (phosphoserine phosphatase)